jgi:hypothetical protein
MLLFSSIASNADDNKEKKEINWAKILKDKKVKHVKAKWDSTKLSYPQPWLTIHLGASYTTNTGSVQLNEGNTPGTMISVRNDLGFSKSVIRPRVNAILNFGNIHFLAFDTYNVLRRDNTVLAKDIKYGDTTFAAGSPVKTRLSLNYVSLNYFNYLYNNGRARLGLLAGVTGVFYTLNIIHETLPDFSQRKSFFVPLPTIGLNGSIYIAKNLFVRAVIKYSAWWSKNYNCNVIDFNPYFEYYIYKNFGVGMRYNVGYTSLKNLPDKKFNGSVSNTFSAVSVVLVYRFVKKDKV